MRWRALLLVLLFPLIASASLLTVTKGRCYNCTPGPPPSGEWADVYVTNVANIGSNLNVNGQTVGVEVGASFATLSQQLTSGNGATMDIVAGGSFDGQENAVRIYPPTALVGGDAQYASWARNVNVWNSGGNNIAQMNMRVLRYYGTRYYDLAPPAKSWGFMNSTVLGEDQNRRLGVFDNYDAAWNPNYRYPYVTVTTVSGYYNPVVPGWLFIDSGPDTTKIMRIGSTINHAASPPQTGGEWVCFEDVMDLRTDRGNPNGLHKMVATWRDGTTRTLEYPLNWDAGWNMSTAYVATFEGIGFYFNRAGTANANNFLMDSHLTFAANLPNTNTLIGCPPGFVTP